MGSKLYGRVRFGQYVLLRTAMPTVRLAIHFGMQYKSIVETTMNICIIAKWIFSCLYVKKTAKLQSFRRSMNASFFVSNVLSATDHSLVRFPTSL